MNTNDDNNSPNGSRYRWFAHPLTTLIVLLATTLIFTLAVGPGFALTVFSGSAAMITQLADAYRRPEQ